MSTRAEKDVAWVLYGVRGAARLWHQRLILAPLPSFQGEFVILTPDGDLYIEDFQPFRNPDLAEIAWETQAGRTPIDVGDDDTYSFGAFPRGRQLERLIEQGEDLAVAEEQRRGAVVGAPPGGPDGGAGVPGRVAPLPPPYEAPPIAEPPRGSSTPRGSERGVRVAPDGQWVAAVADPGLGIMLGDEVVMTVNALVAPDGRRGLAPAPRSLDWIFVERLRPDQKPADYIAGQSAAPSSSDARVLGVQFNAQGVRQRLWRDVVLKIQQVDFKDWPMPGPRTVLWCAQFVDRRGGGPMDHHRWWISNLKLNVTDFGVQEHEHGMRAFQFFGEYDQVDLPNLVGLEVIIRRCQVIEFHYEKKGKGGNKQNEQMAGVSREEAAYFSGSHRMAGEVMICPELVEWVSKEIGRDVEVTKQMRKAREEAKLSRKNDA